MISRNVGWVRWWCGTEFGSYGSDLLIVILNFRLRKVTEHVTGNISVRNSSFMGIRVKELFCDLPFALAISNKRHLLSKVQCESTKSPPEIFWHFFPNGWEFLVQILRAYYPFCLLSVPIYVRLQIFIQLPATLTKLCHIKRDHHHMLKMSTIGRNAR